MAAVWAGHPVRFALLTTETKQFAAYYDAERVMTVASRYLNDVQWETFQLDENLGWDSHNGIVLARDPEGGLHLSGNMHADRLVYFRTRESEKAATFERSEMVGRQESCVTYPQFFMGPGGDLCFGYRDGSSGKGDQIYNRYDTVTRRWERLSKGQVVSGEGKCSAYLDGPHHGPDGYFHLCWVWRDNPDCSTNHDLCYARSRDLVHWETSTGSALKLPITVATAEIVDPVPVRSGLMNGNTRLGFDAEGRVVISYHCLDAGGSTQLYHARNEPDGWNIYQATDWTTAWKPEGCGSMRFQIRVRPVSLDADGRLIHSIWAAERGNIRWVLDPKTMRPLEELSGENPVDHPLLDSSCSDRRINWAADSSVLKPAAPFVLRWESRMENGDRPVDGVGAESSRLSVVRWDPSAVDYPA